jgi:hypothetical protein
MFYAIYKNGVPVQKSTLELTLELPGNYYVFSIGNCFEVNQEGGIVYYDAEGKIQKFRLNSVELISVEKKNINSNWVFQFDIYDHALNTVKRVYPDSNIVEYALASIVKKMSEASEFSSWDKYESSLNAERIRNENQGLKNQILELVKRVENLESQIEKMSKPNV